MAKWNLPEFKDDTVTVEQDTLSHDDRAFLDAAMLAALPVVLRAWYEDQVFDDDETPPERVIADHTATAARALLRARNEGRGA